MSDFTRDAELVFRGFNLTALLIACRRRSADGQRAPLLRDGAVGAE